MKQPSLEYLKDWKIDFKVTYCFVSTISFADSLVVTSIPFDSWIKSVEASEAFGPTVAASEPSITSVAFVRVAAATKKMDNCYSSMVAITAANSVVITATRNR